jgi:imidazolonepropionase-like amidohydrolase
LLVLQNALDEARDFALHRAEFERGAHRDYSVSLTDLIALQSVLAGEVPLLANVHRASDIAGLLKLGQKYGLRLIVNGGAEAWMLAGQLAAANVAVIVAPEANLPANFDRINARSDLATLLADGGVRIAFADGSATTENARNITQSAGNAIVGGLSREAALHAITLSPAEIFGVADRVGSIEVGKEADIVIWPGDPFELSNYPEQVFIHGVSVEMKSRQTLLRDRYMKALTQK